jgi:hypothetical protein
VYCKDTRLEPRFWRRTTSGCLPGSGFRCDELQNLCCGRRHEGQRSGGRRGLCVEQGAETPPARRQRRDPIRRRICGRPQALRRRRGLLCARRGHWRRDARAASRRHGLAVRRHLPGRLRSLRRRAIGRRQEGRRGQEQASGGGADGRAGQGRRGGGGGGGAAARGLVPPRRRRARTDPLFCPRAGRRCGRRRAAGGRGVLCRPRRAAALRRAAPAGPAPALSAAPSAHPHAAPIPRTPGPP